MTDPLTTLRQTLLKHHAVGYAPVWGDQCPICIDAQPHEALAQVETLIHAARAVAARIEWDNDPAWDEPEPLALAEALAPFTNNTP